MNHPYGLMVYNGLYHQFIDIYGKFGDGGSYRFTNIPVECLRSVTMPDTHDLGPLDHPNRRCFKLFPHDVC